MVANKKDKSNPKSTTKAGKAGKTKKTESKTRKKASASSREPVRSKPDMTPFVMPPKPIVTPPPVVEAPPAPVAVEPEPIVLETITPTPAPTEKKEQGEEPSPVQRPKQTKSNKSSSTEKKKEGGSGKSKKDSDKKNISIENPTAIPQVTKKIFPQQQALTRTFVRPAGRNARPGRAAKRSHYKKEDKKAQALEAAVQANEVLAQGDKIKIRYTEVMTVKDLAAAMKVNVTDVIRKLLTLGAPATINQRLETEMAALLAEAFNCEFEVKSIYQDEEIEEAENVELLQPRSPIVTVMGHVDHGKTSLLDAIRSAKVAAGESGGITQHIGAYQVTQNEQNITFLDTPGHAAFTAMRARGAMVTDIVILVVAADDSVMPQTIEAIDHAKAANVPIIVAINKTDLPTANVQKVKQELSQHNILSEDWGGKAQMVEVSAKTQKNIDKLLEAVLLEAEILELKANPNRPAKAVVLEARMDPRRGVTATVLVQVGTLRVGDIVVCGLISGRIRAMTNSVFKPMDTAGPSVPVEILGLPKAPHVGDQLSVVNSDQEAREIAGRRSEHAKDLSKLKSVHVSLENLHDKIEAGDTQELNVILKADVQGSLQAIQDSLGRLSNSQIQLKFVHSGIGNINESDVLLADTSNSILFGFHVKVESTAELIAKKTGVDIRSYSIIYELLADVRAAMEGLLKPVEVEIIKAKAVVKNVFNSSRFGSIAGCMVKEGKAIRGNKAKLIRNAEVVAIGSLVSLKRFKDDVKEVEKGYECGMAIEGVKTYQPNDEIEVFVIEKQARRLES